MLEPDPAVLIDKISCRPVNIVERFPRRIAIILRDGIGDIEVLDSRLDVGCVFLKTVLGSIHTDYHRAVCALTTVCAFAYIISLNARLTRQLRARTTLVERSRTLTDVDGEMVERATVISQMMPRPKWCGPVRTRVPAEAGESVPDSELSQKLRTAEIACVEFARTCLSTKLLGSFDTLR